MELYKSMNTNWFFSSLDRILCTLWAEHVEYFTSGIGNLLLVNLWWSLFILVGVDNGKTSTLYVTPIGLV